MAKRVFVTRTKRRFKKGQSRMVFTGGFSRAKRPVSKVRIIDKKPVKLFPVRDEFGRIQGFKPRRRKKRGLAGASAATRQRVASIGGRSRRI